MALPPEIADLATIEDPVKRRATFVALLTRAVTRDGGEAPLVVGGLAVELYTFGNYTTSDIDLKGPHAAIDRLLRAWGFAARGGSYARADLGLYVDWIGEGPQAPQESRDKIQTISVGSDLFLRVVGPEDIIIDRLCAAKFWRDLDSRAWAADMLATLERAGRPVDVVYLRGRAAAEDVADLLDEVLPRG